MWSRIRNSPRQGTRRPSVSDIGEPKLRFNYTKEACFELLKQMKHENRRYDLIASEMQILDDVFKEEANGVEDNICVRYFISQDCLQVLSIHFKEFPSYMVTKMCSLIRNILESDHTGVVSRDKNLILGLSTFLNSMISYRIDRHSEEVFSELLFVIASRLKAEPQQLIRWFQLLGLLSQDEHDSQANGDHPLFYLLLDYVYHEGNVGDYARTGLLYLIEVISSSPQLERWMIKSDLSTLMASGLGALYSQLSRGIKQNSNLCGEEPPIITLSNDSRMKRELDIVQSKSPSTQNSGSEPPEMIDLKVKHNLQTFLSYLQFWQDMLMYCRSETLATCLLVHFDIIFLRQLLYPSLIESTDNEGGYSISIITILRFILHSLDHNKLSQLIVCYFLGVTLNDDYTAAVHSFKDFPEDAFLSGEDGTPLLTLKDVIFSGLESKSSEMVTATLQLLRCLVQKYYPYVQKKLLTTTKDSTSNSAHNIFGGDLKALQNIQIDLGQNEQLPVDEYESDMEMRILTSPFIPTEQSCSLLPEELERLEALNRSLLEQVGIHPTRQKIRPDDRLMNCILRIFCKYYNNSTDINLVLTGLLIDLGTCRWVSLRGWFFADLDSFNQKNNNENTLNYSQMLKILKDLADQYQHYSLIIESFDSGLLEFEGNLKVGHDISDALKTGPDSYLINIHSQSSSSDETEVEEEVSLSFISENNDDNNDSTESNDNSKDQVDRDKRHNYIDEEDSDGELVLTPSRLRQPLAKIRDATPNKPIRSKSSISKNSPKITDQFGTLPRRLVSKVLSSQSTNHAGNDNNSPARLLFPQSDQITDNSMFPDTSQGTTSSSRKSDPLLSETLLEKIASRVQLIPPPTLDLEIPVSNRLVEPSFSIASTISLSQLFGNIIILREFIREMQALIRVRAWLIDSAA